MTTSYFAVENSMPLHSRTDIELHQPGRVLSLTCVKSRRSSWLNL
jgi:hypothetical protein